MSTTGLSRLVILGIVLTISTGALWLTRRLGWAEIRAVCIALPLGLLLGHMTIDLPPERAFDGAAWYASWSGVIRPNLRLFCDGIQLGVGTAAVMWTLIMVSYIACRTLKR